MQLRILICREETNIIFSGAVGAYIADNGLGTSISDNAVGKHKNVFSLVFDFSLRLIVLLDFKPNTVDNKAVGWNNVSLGKQNDVAHDKVPHASSLSCSKLSSDYWDRLFIYHILKLD